jgi:hypothetical protein
MYEANKSDTGDLLQSTAKWRDVSSTERNPHCLYQPFCSMSLQPSAIRPAYISPSAQCLQSLQQDVFKGTTSNPFLVFHIKLQLRVDMI